MKIYFKDETNIMRKVELDEILNLFYIDKEYVLERSKANLSFVILKEFFEISWMEKSEKSYTFENTRVDKRREIKRKIFERLCEIEKYEPMWGILTGIRPSKICMKLLKNGNSEEEIYRYYEKNFKTHKSKIDLCINVAKESIKFTDIDKQKVSIYISMAFCPSICNYCTFASLTYKDNLEFIDPYIKALEYEIIETKKFIMEKEFEISTIYFGGGTPTSIDEIRFDYLMKKIYENLLIPFKKHENFEYTCEAGRCDSISFKKLESMKKYGVTRISINPQSMVKNTLKSIGRNHNGEDVIKIFNMSRKIGFNNINMDIILGLENEGLEDIKFTLSEIEKLKPESLTIHSLAIKKGSKIYETKMNKIEKQFLADKMMELAIKSAKRMRMMEYYMYRQKNSFGNLENIGFSKKGFQCIYNIEMIEENRSIISIGEGAVSKIVNDNVIERFFNKKNIKEYCEKINKSIKEKHDMFNMEGRV